MSLHCTCQAKHMMPWQQAETQDRNTHPNATRVTWGKKIYNNHCQGEHTITVWSVSVRSRSVIAWIKYYNEAKGGKSQHSKPTPGITHAVEVCYLPAFVTFSILTYYGRCFLSLGDTFSTSASLQTPLIMMMWVECFISPPWLICM